MARLTSAEYSTRYREANRPAYNEYMRKWSAENKAKNPEKVALSRRKSALKRKYGFTVEEYDVMFARQRGKCALCDRTPADEKYGHLNVDHCHETGRIRGLLCTVHNRAIATLGDNEEGLIKAIAYLKGGV